MLLESVVCHNFRRCGPPDRTRAQSRLLSRRMLGSLYRRFFLVSVQAARGRYRHVRMASRARCTSRAHGQVQGSNFFCACCWRSGQPARSRAQPPAAPHASRPCGAAARRPPLVTRAAQEVDWSHCRYVATPLCRCTARSLRRYVSTPLCRYAATPLCRYAAMSLCRCVAVPRGAHARL